MNKTNPTKHTLKGVNLDCIFLDDPHDYTKTDSCNWAYWSKFFSKFYNKIAKNDFREDKNDKL